jgi:hypothetical protein
MYGRLAPSYGRGIHDIVVYQGKIMEDFYGQGGIKGFFVASVKNFGR